MHELTEALVEEAQVDLDAAKDLFQTKKYARVVFFCQQALEKLAKAILTEEGHGTILDHQVSTLLSLEIMKKTTDKNEEFIREAITTLAGLEREVAKTRYPFRLRGTIFSPSKEFSEKSAERWLEKSGKAFSVLSAFLENY
jgi:HEPN domain-containing protein